LLILVRNRGDPNLAIEGKRKTGGSTDREGRRGGGRKRDFSLNSRRKRGGGKGSVPYSLSIRIGIGTDRRSLAEGEERGGKEKYEFVEERRKKRYLSSHQLFKGGREQKPGLEKRRGRRKARTPYVLRERGEEV